MRTARDEMLTENASSMVEWDKVFHLVTAHMVIGVALHTDRFLYTNAALHTLLDYSEEELRSMAAWSLCDEPSRTQLKSLIETGHQTLMSIPASLRQTMDQTADPPGPATPLRLQMRTKSGAMRWLDAYLTPVPSHDVFIINFLDVTDQMTLLQHLDRETQTLQSMLDAMPVPLLVARNRVIYTNPAAEQWLGYPREILAHMTPNRLSEDQEAVQRLMRRLLHSDRPGSLLFEEIPRLPIKTERGVQRWARVVARSIWYQNDWAVLIILTDVTSEVFQEQAMAQETDYYRTLAEVDALTQVSNRRVLDHLLVGRLGSQDLDPRTFGLLMVDVDHFKQVNDTVGHDVGDEVLREVAQLLRQSVREHDLVARYGGEEFMIVVDEKSLDEVVQLAERIRTIVSYHEFRIISHITVSVGVTMRNIEDTPARMIHRVDQALYTAKTHGRNCVRVE